MHRYQGVGAVTALREEPGKNHYAVKLGRNPQDDPACVVDIFVDTLTYQVTRTEVAVAREDELKGMSREAILKIAEIEINALPSLPMYALIPDAHPLEEIAAIPT